ncbi:MAG: hypothetical protein WBW47_07425 [Thermoplasmata archaeon]
MTAMSATSTRPTPSTANPFPELAQTARTVLLHGSPATYANRAYLRDLGLRWDPERQQWHGTTTPGHVRVLREQLGIEVRCFGTLDQPPRGPSPPSPSVAVLAPALPSVPCSAPRPRFGDYSRTRFESQVAFGGPDEDEGEDAEDQSIIAAPTRQFSLLETTSGLPDDSREADERAAERRLRDLRWRVKAARAAISTTPGLADTLHSDWQRAARFYARFKVNESQLRFCLPTEPVDAVDGEISCSIGSPRTPSRFDESLQLVRWLWPQRGR